MKDTLAFDPFIDVVLGRVPHLFIRPDPNGVEQTARAVGELAEAMGPEEARVVFPEGGNFTVGRQRRAVARLWHRGLAVHARRAERLRHLLPPRPAGIFAAIDAAPCADVVFVAHTGLDHLASVADAWRAI